MRIPAALNLLLTAGFVLGGGVVFVALPLWLLPLAPVWALLLVPWALSANTHWSVMHEAVHGHLHPRPWVNRAAGRILGVVFGGPFAGVRAAHLVHHRFNGSVADRPEVYPGRPHRVRYFVQLLAGLHVLQMATSLLLLLPARWRGPFLRLASSDESYRSSMAADLASAQAGWGARWDGLLIAALYAGGFAAYGSAWPLLASALLLRAFLISFLDNSYHYGLPLGDVVGARNARFAAGGLWLHFNLHGVHHRHVQAPWTELPRLHREEGAAFDAGLLGMALAQLRGPIEASRLEPPAPGPAPAASGEAREPASAATAAGSSGGGATA